MLQTPTVARFQVTVQRATTSINKLSFQKEILQETLNKDAFMRAEVRAWERSLAT